MINATNFSEFINNRSNNDEGDLACLEWYDNVDQCDWLKRCKKLAASLSITGCLLTVFIIWLFKKYTEFSQRMIIHLSIATFLQAIFYLLVDIELEATVICKIQGALLQYIAWVILLWIISIIFNLLWNVIWLQHLAMFEIRISIFCWGLPVVIAAVPFADDAYAPAGAWCWYKNDYWWILGTWYAWSLISFVFIFISTIVITYKLRARSKDVVGTYDADYTRRNNSIREAVRTLRLYPIAYFLVIIFPMIHRIQNIAEASSDTQEDSFVTSLLHSLTDPLDGAVITLVFVMDRRTRHVLNFKSIREALKKKFHSEASIHELILKSKLSQSDFVVAARKSIISIEVDPPPTQDRNTTDRVISDTDRF